MQYIFEEYKPDEKLTDFIEFYWYYKNLSEADSNFDVAPDCCVDLIFELNTGNVRLFGPNTSLTTVKIPAKSELFGIVFRPGIAGFLINQNMNDLTDQIIHNVIGSNLFKKEIQISLQQIIFTGNINSTLEIVNLILLNMFTKIFNNSKKDTQKLNLVLKIVNITNFSTYKIGDFVSCLNLKERTLQRFFNRYIGLTPKRFLKIKRSSEANLNISVNSDKASQSVRFGYYDQSHMKKEFKQILKKK